VLDATELPDTGVVMGFGYVGLEMAPYLAEAGVDLAVVEHDERPLDEADPAFGDELLDMYREEFGVEIRTEATEETVEPTADGGVRLTLRDGEIEADGLFLFTGRRPTLDGLGLDAAGNDPGAGWVRDTMQTRDDDRVYVVGDANGREPILHVAKEQGFQTAANLLAADRGDPIEPYTNVHHHVIFAGAGRYPFARVGHTPRSATEAGHATVTATRRAADDGVFETKHAARGLARLVVDATDGTVLGWQALHLHADVMAKALQVAVELGLDVRDVPDRSYHPTTPEILDGLIRECAAGVADG
jgi:dihydrolipoamide dehydrogenase